MQEARLGMVQRACAVNGRRILPGRVLQPDLRCFASKRDNDNKSWGELAEEAADVAKLLSL